MRGATAYLVGGKINLRLSLYPQPKFELKFKLWVWTHSERPNFLRTYHPRVGPQSFGQCTKFCSFLTFPLAMLLNSYSTKRILGPSYSLIRQLCWICCIFTTLMARADTTCIPIILVRTRIPTKFVGKVYFDTSYLTTNLLIFYMCFNDDVTVCIEAYVWNVTFVLWE